MVISMLEMGDKADKVHLGARSRGKHCSLITPVGVVILNSHSRVREGDNFINMYVYI